MVVAASLVHLDASAAVMVELELGNAPQLARLANVETLGSPKDRVCRFWLAPKAILRTSGGLVIGRVPV